MFQGSRGITSAPMTRFAVPKRTAQRSGCSHFGIVSGVSTGALRGARLRVGMKKSTAAMAMATVPSSIIPA